jgi:hypothetical protein
MPLSHPRPLIRPWAEQGLCVLREDKFSGATSSRYFTIEPNPTKIIAKKRDSPDFSGVFYVFIFSAPPLAPGFNCHMESPNEHQGLMYPRAWGFHYKSE